MSEETNYTIIDDEEDQPALTGEAVVRPRARELVIAIALLVMGLGVIALAGWCATVQASVFAGEGVFSRSKAWITAMTLPLSIAGALLVVAGVLVGMARYWKLGLDAASAPAAVERESPAVVESDASGA